MKKITSPILVVAFIVGCALYFSLSKSSTETLMDQKRKKHEKFLAESPFNETKNLSRSERKKLGLPPNAYNERLFELTMNPDLGFPTPFLVETIDITSPQAKAAPGSVTSPWVERGPLNVGGRTRVVFFDPNDVGTNNGDGVDFNRVFAGGVGGGLWVNENITSSASFWRIIPGLAANLSVSAFAIDPNNSNIIYIGTGEQYTSGAAVGNGLYKSEDGGDTWSLVNIQVAGGGDAGNGNSLFKAGIFNINDIIARDVNGTTEIYVGVGASDYRSPNFTTTNPNNFLGTQSAGIYRSVDNGATWSRNEEVLLTFPIGNGSLPVVPNDFEIGSDNTLYMSTIDSPGFGAGGGRVYASDNGINWRIESTIPGANRTEIAASRSNPDKFYVLANVNGEADLFITNDQFSTLESISEPNDVDNGIPADDFTRGQAFYDLVVETNPNDDSEVYLGGINVHRSRNSGDSWQQISRWSNNRNMNTLNASFVHADIHAITFRPDGSNAALIGSDGGVSFTPDIAQSGSPDIQNRILGYNVTQFYYGDIDQSNFEDGDDFVGGTQDNGSPIFNNSVQGSNLTATFDALGGDGSFSAIDDESVYTVLGFVRRNHFYFEYPITNSSSSYRISNDNDGDFINVGELDSAFDVFYANSRTANGSNSITACELGTTSATCIELAGGALSNIRATAMKASPFTTSRPRLFVGSQNSRLLVIDNSNSDNRIITEITSPDFLGSVSDIEFGSSEQEIYVTFHNYGVNNIWYTDDGGDTWSQKDGNLPDVPVKAILQSPLIENEVIIGTQTGIYSTSDFDSDNPTWTMSINGMTNVPVYDLDLRTADNTVLASTHGRGMFTGKFTAQTASTTSVDASLALSVYPTQATSEIFIESDQNFSDVNISIYNLNGQEVYRSNNSLSSNRERIDVSTLSTGIYFLKANGEGLDQTTKFLKQ